ncbi:MAG: hypothetical protein ACPL5F_10495 [Moorellaceae bacterium]
MDKLLLAGEKFLLSKTAQNWVWFIAGIALLCFFSWATQAVFVAAKMFAMKVGLY